MDPSKLTQKDFQVIRDILPTILKQSKFCVMSREVTALGNGAKWDDRFAFLILLWLEVGF